MQMQTPETETGQKKARGHMILLQEIKKIHPLKAFSTQPPSLLATNEFPPTLSRQCLIVDRSWCYFHLNPGRHRLVLECHPILFGPLTHKLATFPGERD